MIPAFNVQQKKIKSVNIINLFIQTLESKGQPSIRYISNHVVYDRPGNKVVAMRDAKSNQTDPTVKGLTAEQER